MEENKKEKLTYEQLEETARQLLDQNVQMKQQIQSMHMSNIFKRLDYLFKVVDSMAGFSKEFVDKCMLEIENLMTIPEEEVKEKTEE